jgi:peroxiredoxin
MPRSLTATAIGLVLALSLGLAQKVATAKSPAPEVTSPAAAKIDNFRLVDATGISHELYRLKDAPAVVIVAESLGSADVRKMAPELEKVRAAYAGKGVEFFMLNPSLKDTREAVAAEAKTLGLAMPVLMDEQQLVGEQIGAMHASEVFVINPKTWTVVYRGPLADAKSKASATGALDAVLAGQPVSVALAPVAGTAISYPNATAAAKAGFAKISYTKTIAPLIEQKCVVCHEQGGIAPFAFDSYEKVKGYSGMMREAIRTDRMPPWDPDPHVGHFKDDKGLSSDQIKTLVHWIEAGAPRGDGADTLSASPHVAPNWPLGKPDLIIDIPSYTIPAAGVVDYQYPVVPNPLTEGKWLKASTTQVDQRQAVHHILSGFIKEGETRRGMQAWGSSVGGYTVGMESVVNPKGMGTYVPPGGSIGFQMHYTPFGKEVTAKQQVGLYFYKDGEKPDLMMREMPLVNQFIKIPANDPAHKEVAYFIFPKDALLYTTVAHAHYRGAASTLTIRYPDGKEKLILNVPKYDFNWQRMYEYDQPIPIPAGSKVIATYTYDNSKRNPANPDANKEIVWGDQSFEEMFYTSLRYRWMDETAAKQTNYDDLLQQSRLMGMMDSNIDDKIQKDELRGQFAQLLGSQAMFDKIDANHDGGIDAAEMEKGLAMMPRRGPPAAAPAAATAPAAPTTGSAPTGGR